MKCVIFCFSGTGNTLKVVDEYRAHLEERGVEVAVRKVTNRLDNFGTDDFDLVGIAYPIHGFNAPEPIIDLVKQLPASDKKYFVVKTSGEMLKLNNISSNKMAKILKKKGYTQIGEYHYAMPYNMIFRHTDNMASLMFDTAKSLVPLHVDEILSGNGQKLDKVFLGSFIAWLFRIEHKFMPINGKHFKTNDSCVHCGLCERVCPKGNIRLDDGKVQFGDKCVGCMACAFACPKNAINTAVLNGWKVNGKYDFSATPKMQEGDHENYCKRSYVRYFESAKKVKAEGNKDNK